jgi:hypothetical protein
MHILRTLNVIYSGTTGGAGNVNPSNKIEEILTIGLSFPDIEADMEIFDNISSTRRCLASKNNTNVVTDCNSTYIFSTNLILESM